MPGAEFSDRACEDVRAIGEPLVVGELILIGRSELRVPPSPRTSLDGRVMNPVTKQEEFWRRAIRLQEVDEYCRQDLPPEVGEAKKRLIGCVYIYDWITTDEAIDRKVPRDTFMIDRVLSEPEAVRTFMELDQIEGSLESYQAE